MKNLIIVGFARSGVTLVNRYLAGDQRLLCLSEINSMFLCPTLPNTIKDQVREWYSLNLKEDNFFDNITELLNIFKNKKPIILRDWSFGSFVKCRHNNFSPTMSLNTIDDIQNKFLDNFVSLAVIRNPIDVWLSMRYSEKTFYDKNLESYYLFIDDVLKRNIDLIKYEDFCVQPEIVINSFYEVIGIISPKEFVLSNNVIGDINYPNSSRGVRNNFAKKLPRRHMSEEDKKFLVENTKAREICDLLHYDFDLS